MLVIIFDYLVVIFVFKKYNKIPLLLLLLPLIIIIIILIIIITLKTILLK